MRRRALALLCLLSALGDSGCQPKGPELSEVERLNGEAGNVGRYMVAYYAAVDAAADGGALATWMKEEPPHRTVVFRQAPKAGAPFSPEAYLTPDDMRGTITIGLMLLPGAHEGELYAAWQARRPANGDKFVVFRGSRDHGATWSKPSILNTLPTAFGPGLASDRNGGVYAAWPDERGYTTAIFVNRSLDHGATWMPEDVRIDAGEGGGQMANAVAVASDGADRVLVVWEEQESAGRVVMSALSRDRGATWSSPVRVDDGKGRGAPLAPRAAFAGGRAVVTWTAAVNGVNAFAQVWADSSGDGGTTWGDDVLLHEQPGGAAPTMQLLADQSLATVVFEARARGGSDAVYFVSMRPDGTWIATQDELKPLTPTDGKASAPRIAKDEHGTFLLVYTEGPRRVRLLRSKDGGAHWDPPLTVYERAEANPPVTVRFPQVAVGGGAAYVMWEEWGDAKSIVKTLGDAQTKRPPLDLFIRRITFHD
jgi:hypothetical protein